MVVSTGKDGDEMMRISREPTADAPGSDPKNRGDIQVKGQVAPDGASGVIDITFAAVSAPLYLERIKTIIQQPGESTRDWTKRQLGYLLAFREKEKRLKYRNCFRDPFSALAFSTGGFPSSKSKQWLLRLQSTKRRSESFIFDLSAVLARTKAAALN